jgi:hypothetical protein
MVAFSLAQGATPTWKAATTGDWFTAANWTDGSIPLAGDDVVVTNAGSSILLTNSTPYLGSLLLAGVPGVSNTLVFSNWNTTLSATNVTIASNGWMTLPVAFTNNQMSNNVCIVCTNLTLDRGGVIDVNGRGFQGGAPNYGAGHGPGKGPEWGTGGGHGGYGGHRAASSIALGGVPYGVTNAPVSPGSGGGAYTSNGGSGGGAVRIDAPHGTVTINGAIRAQGGDGAAAYSAGGSGGSVWIACRVLAGSNGLVTAAGGSASGNANWGGGGGGGRIAVIYDPGTQAQLAKPAVTFSAAPGTNVSGGAYVVAYGTPGTLYFPDAALLDGTWFPHSGQIILGSGTWNPDSLTLSNVWVSFPTARFALTVSNDVRVTGANGRLDIGGDTFWRKLAIGTSAYAPFFYSDTTSPPTLRIGGNVTLTNGGSLYVNSGSTNAANPDHGALITVAGHVLVAGNSMIVSRSNPTNGGSPLFQVRTMTVLTNGLVRASATGFSGGEPAYGPGRPTAGAAGGGPAGGWGVGAGYGGQGGTNVSGFSGGPIYGSSNAPVDPGSGGRGYDATAGFGGGLVRVEAEQTIRINGTMTAQGGYGWNSWSGGGSGGGIFLRCVEFAGDPGGVLSAAGGDGQGKAPACSAGGGGRIAVWRRKHSFQGSTSVTNGTAPGLETNGQPGSLVWWQLPGSGSLIVIR